MPRLRQVKHWFIPHKLNDHRPHLIRLPGLVVVAALVLGLQASALAMRTANLPTPPHSNVGSVLAYATDITPAELYTDTNQQRAANGLAPLTLDPRLDQSATLKAQNMFQEDYWAHVSPSGIQPWYWFAQAGYNYSYAGENLAKDFDTSDGVMQGWMNSPGHRANILNTHYTDVGFAVENGVLVGGETTLVVAHYGAPATPALAASNPAPSARPSTAPAPVALAATPDPSAEPSAVPTPSATPKPVAPVVNGEISAGPSAPSAKSYSLFAPLSLTRTLSWPTLLTVLLLLVLFSVYLVTHLAVWRKGLKRWRTPHYKLYAAGSLGCLIVAIVLLATSGFGMVG